MSEISTKAPSSLSLAERIHDRPAGPGRLLTLATSVDDVVSWRGSFLAYPDLAAGDDLRQELAVSLLDKGTENRDRFELAHVLESAGAKLNLSSDGLYVDVSGRSLVSDLPAVMDVLSEMLQVPTFDPEEFEKARAQAIADVRRRMEKTSAQASAALTRRIFGAGHPNYRSAPEDVLLQLESFWGGDVERYHAKHFGATEWTMAVVGDVDHDRVERIISDCFSDWSAADVTPAHEVKASSASDPGRTVINMPGKSNVDVRMGHALPIRRDHEDYPALYVGNYILGGNFAARLMATVRDEKGLTYSIGSSVSGMTTRYDGYWQVRVTLSQEQVDEGISATKAVIQEFVEDGATEEELEEKKTTITGSYTVGLSTTHRLAQSILTNAERGFDVEYLDRFPREIESLSLETVNAAVQRHFQPHQMHEALAGRVPEDDDES